MSIANDVQKFKSSKVITHKTQKGSYNCKKVHKLTHNYCIHAFTFAETSFNLSRFDALWEISEVKTINFIII